MSVMSRDFPTVIGFEVMRMRISASGELIPKTKCGVDQPGKANVSKQLTAFQLIHTIAYVFRYFRHIKDFSESKKDQDFASGISKVLLK